MLNSLAYRILYDNYVPENKCNMKCPYSPHTEQKDIIFCKYTNGISLVTQNVNKNGPSNLY